jgi:hypothetical protein
MNFPTQAFWYRKAYNPIECYLLKRPMGFPESVVLDQAPLLPSPWVSYINGLRIC